MRRGNQQRKTQDINGKKATAACGRVGGDEWWAVIGGRRGW